MTSSLKVIDAAPHADEVTWIDAWVRWERNQFCEDDAEEEDMEEPKEELAYETFDFEFPYDDTKVAISLKGFPNDSEQVWNSTGMTVWRATDVLCQYLVKHRATLVEGQDILELGSGLGLGGLVAHQLQQKACAENKDSENKQQEGADEKRGDHVYMTDGDSNVLVQLRLNVDSNSSSEASQQPPQSSDYSNAAMATISSHQLLWGTESAQTFMGRIRNDQPMDVVLGSELVYVPNVIRPLFETVQVLLKPKGIFVLTYCTRRTADSNKQVTIDDILQVAVDEFQLLPKQVYNDDDIYVYEFHKP